ncbi:hypothetical protein ElyMa_005630500 [Elysia marginata]|uniref:UDENN domain-containing protein n=1 Tax=Elysia marginata TaxID=1093978 RepID=A0AAV4F879_9GAST|nr:hypothetical protein ElyMa_005630500 [Elysia marginata]
MAKTNLSIFDPGLNMTSGPGFVFPSWGLNEPELIKCITVSNKPPPDDDRFDYFAFMHLATYVPVPYSSLPFLPSRGRCLHLRFRDQSYAGREFYLAIRACAVKSHKAVIANIALAHLANYSISLVMTCCVIICKVLRPHWAMEDYNHILGYRGSVVCTLDL